MCSVALSLATLGPIGYLKAPGTIATLVALGGVYGLKLFFPSSFSYTAAVFGCVVIAYLIITRALKDVSPSHHDPSEIVLDEVVGTMIVFIGIPYSWPTVLGGFILFRLFDITKCGPIKMVERFPAAWGILADDLLAGLMATIVLRLIS